MRLEQTLELLLYICFIVFMFAQWRWNCNQAKINKHQYKSIDLATSGAVLANLQCLSAIKPKSKALKERKAKSMKALFKVFAKIIARI